MSSKIEMVRVPKAQLERWADKLDGSDSAGYGWEDLLSEELRAILAQPVADEQGGPVSAQDEREAIARAIWNVRREDEDRCDMDLEDMGEDHSVWREADAVLAAPIAQAAPQPEQSGLDGEVAEKCDTCEGLTYGFPEAKWCCHCGAKLPGNYAPLRDALSAQGGEQ